MMNQTNHFFILHPGTILANGVGLVLILASTAQAQSSLSPPLIEGQPSTLPAFPANINQRYLVYLRSNSPVRLREIRRFIPQASIQPYQGEQVIQAGIYREALDAFAQAERLRERGYMFEVVELNLNRSPGILPTIPAGIPSGSPTPFPAINPALGAVEYWVFVNGNSPLLLAQIQQVVPDAFVTQLDGRTVIQAGAFQWENHAQERLNRLRSRGILADLVGTQGGSSVSTVPSLPLNPSNPALVSEKGYYVIIPSSENNINLIANQIRQMAPNTVNVFPKRSRRGHHVAVGPYPNRSQAAEMRLVLVNLGLTNARVYFGR